MKLTPSGLGKPIAAINLGRTRADPLLAFKIEQPCAEALAALVAGSDYDSAARRPAAAARSRNV